MDPIEVMLKEYETLRQESLTSMHNRNSVLAFGLAAISAILTACIATSGTADDALLHLMLIGLVPAVSVFVLVMWFGEHRRNKRAGKHLVRLEKKINDEAGRPQLLTFETNLPDEHVKYPYYAVPLLLMGIGACSFIKGAYDLRLPACCFYTLVTVGSIVAVGICIFTFWLIFKVNRERDEASREATKEKAEINDTGATA